MMINRYNKYQIMWVFVHFDLPTETKRDRKNYSTFRKFLLEDGFKMIQFSIYARHCSSRENSAVHKIRVKKALPPKGHVIVFDITDAQFGKMEIFYSQKPAPPKDMPVQLELF